MLRTFFVPSREGIQGCVQGHCENGYSSCANAAIYDLGRFPSYFLVTKKVTKEVFSARRSPCCYHTRGRKTSNSSRTAARHTMFSGRPLGPARPPMAGLVSPLYQEGNKGCVLGHGHCEACVMLSLSKHAQTWQSEPPSLRGWLILLHKRGNLLFDLSPAPLPSGEGSRLPLPQRGRGQGLGHEP